jgi:hypothetical protein
MGNDETLARLQKDDHIIRLLAQLQERLGVGAFQIVDHWEADLRAIGIAHPSNVQRLAYIAAPDPAHGSFYVELEDEPQAGSDLPYSLVGRYRNISFDELVRLVAAHFRSASEPSG